MVLKCYAHFQAWRTYLRARIAERGVETIEWIGMAVVVLAIVAGVATFVEAEGGESIGRAIINALIGMIGQLTGGGKKG